MLSTGNKTFMNLQEAVGWLLENNALPFQSTANYVGNTEIAMSTLINPSPAKVRVGSIIFFADSKVSTVIGVTSNSFIVSDQYNDLVDDVVYVSNVALNGSGHLIVTLSDGTDIDAGLIKQVTNISINSSQHLIVNYNDGSSVDVGALGDFSNADFTAKTLKQAQANYSQSYGALNPEIEPIFMRIQEINNVIRFIANFKLTNSSGASKNYYSLMQANLFLSQEISEKIYDILGGRVSEAVNENAMIATAPAFVRKSSSGVGANSAIIASCNMTIVNRATANFITIYISKDDNSALTLADGESVYATARIDLTLI